MKISRTSSRKKSYLSSAAVVLGALLFSACAGDPGLAGEWGSGSEQNYVSSDGRILEIAENSRGAAPVFEGELDTGGQFTSSELQGNVSVINFWYAGCPPCRVEAADLEATYQEFLDDGVQFLGVNVRDTAETALSFAETYQVTYPSILDIETASAQLAFAGVVPPNAVPTTLVLDREGRVSARLLGIIEPGTLKSILQVVLDEGSEATSS